MAVGRMLQRLTHRDIAQNVVGSIEHDVARGGRVGQADGEFLAVHVLADRVRIQHILAEDQVNLAVLERHDARLVVRNDLDRDFLDGGRLTPEVFVPFKNRVLVRDKVGQYIRTGANVTVYAVLRAAVDHALWRDHRKRTDAAQLGEHGIIRLTQLDDKGIGIRRRNADQQIHHLKPGVPFLVLDDRVEVRQNGVRVAQCAV